MKPKLAAFPKCYMDELCVHKTMTLVESIQLAATLGVEGLEFYSGFLQLENDGEPFYARLKAPLKRHIGCKCPCSAALPISLKLTPAGVRGGRSTVKRG